MCTKRRKPRQVRGLGLHSPAPPQAQSETSWPRSASNSTNIRHDNTVKCYAPFFGRYSNVVGVCVGSCPKLSVCQPLHACLSSLVCQNAKRNRLRPGTGARSQFSHIFRLRGAGRWFITSHADALGELHRTGAANLRLESTRPRAGLRTRLKLSSGLQQPAHRQKRLWPWCANWQCCT